MGHLEYLSVAAPEFIDFFFDCRDRVAHDVKWFTHARYTSAQELRVICIARCKRTRAPHGCQHFRRHPCFGQENTYASVCFIFRDLNTGSVQCQMPVMQEAEAMPNASSVGARSQETLC